MYLASILAVVAIVVAVVQILAVGEDVDNAIESINTKTEEVAPAALAETSTPTAAATSGDASEATVK